METCKNKKKEEPTTTAIETLAQVSKPLRPLNYLCHICKIVGGHKLMNCLRFGEMKNIFKDKGGKTTKTKSIVKINVVIASVNMMGVNVTTQRKKMNNMCLKIENQGRTNLQLVGK